MLVPQARFCSDPMLKAFEEREKRIEGSKRTARQDRRGVGRGEAKYEAEVQRLREAGNTEREKLAWKRSAGKRDFGPRPESTAKTLEEGRQEGCEQAAQRAPPCAFNAGARRDIASRVLGREVEG